MEINNMIIVSNLVSESCHDTDLFAIDTGKITDPILKQKLEKAKAPCWVELTDDEFEELQSIPGGSPRFPTKVHKLVTICVS